MKKYPQISCKFLHPQRESHAAGDVTVDETPEEPPVKPGETIPVNGDAVDQSKAEVRQR